MLRVVILIFALAAGGVAAWLVLSLQSSDETTVVTAGQSPSDAVLVAVVDIAQGTKLDAANMRWQDWPQDAVNEAFILRSARPDAPEALLDTVVQSHIVSGEPILDEKLRTLDGSFLSNILPSGKRAVALRISAESSAGGFILPNDRVDVLYTISGEEGRTTTLLRNVRVLAIDQSAEQDTSSESLVGKTATLELDPEQTELFTARQASGTLSLSLRSTADRDEVQTIETAVVETTPQLPSQEVLVAVADLAQGDKLDATNIGWQNWPKDTLNDAFILRSVRPDAIETLLDTVVQNPFVSGEAILDEKLKEELQTSRTVNIFRGGRSEFVEIP